MHDAFDQWMARNHPHCPFERYADDGVVHCDNRRQAEELLAGIAARMSEVGLRLHPDKTHVVYCKDSNRRGASTSTSRLPSSGTPSCSTGGDQRKEGRALHVVLACDQPRGAQSQKRPAPRPADPPSHRPDAGRPGGLAEPHHRRVDAPRRPDPPVESGSPPAARQHLPEALGWEEVQAAADLHAVQAGGGPGYSKESQPCSPTGSGSARTDRPVRRAG